MCFICLILCFVLNFVAMTIPFSNPLSSAVIVIVCIGLLQRDVIATLAGVCWYYEYSSYNYCILLWN
ncbi:MAG: exopolysaccharide biosynthesis protein [Pseudoalteromonas sp.]